MPNASKAAFSGFGVTLDAPRVPFHGIAGRADNLFERAIVLPSAANEPEREEAESKVQDGPRSPAKPDTLLSGLTLAVVSSVLLWLAVIGIVALLS